MTKFHWSGASPVGPGHSVWVRIPDILPGPDGGEVLESRSVMARISLTVGLL